MTFSESHRIVILLKSDLKCLTNNYKRKTANNILVTIVQYTSARYSAKLYDIITQNNTVSTLVAIFRRESYGKYMLKTIFSQEHYFICVISFRKSFLDEPLREDWGNNVLLFIISTKYINYPLLHSVVKIVYP